MINAYINGTSLLSLGMAVGQKTIGNAAPNIQTIEVPGMDGVLDVTDFVGLTYGNRPIEFTLLVTDRNRFSESRLFLESWNGQEVDLTFSDEPNLVWHGRIVMGDYGKYERSRIKCLTSMSMSAYPFPTNSITGEEVRSVSNFG